MDPNWLSTHQLHWETCERCPLHLHASRHVLFDLGEGLAPSVLFIGEGPGRSENLIGRPFVGKAGRLLRTAVEMARKGVVPKPSVAYANLVACRPCDDARGPNRAPTQVEVESCMPRLMELIMNLNPATICLLGKVPTSYKEVLKSLLPKPSYRELAHPSWIVRRGGVLSKDWPTYLASLEEVLRS